MLDLEGAVARGGRRSRPRLRGSLAVRFLRLVIQPDDPAACWGWAGALFRSGYGAIAAEPPSRAMLLAHRVSYELHHGPIPPGLCVLHHCDVRPCSNPRHLFLGTKRDNNRDKISKGRQPTGEGHHWAKLTWRQVEQIRAMRAANSAPMQQIASAFGVSRSLISMILANKIWRTHEAELMTA